MSCCGKQPRQGKDVGNNTRITSNDNITLSYAGDECLDFNDKCPLDRSGLRLVRRPTSHWRCKANGHRWRICT